MTYSSEVLADSPLVYYRLGEASGTTMTDSSGNGRNGTYTSVTLAAAGLLTGDADTAGTFSGSGFGTVAHDAAWDSPSVITLEAWVKPSSVAAGNKIIMGRANLGATGAGLPGNYQAFLYQAGGASFRFFVAAASGDSTGTDLVGSLTITAGTTYHVVGTYDGADVRLYINGTQVASVAKTGTLAAGGTNPLRVGSVNFAGQRFVGVGDEFAMYGTALSSIRVAAHYAAGTAAPAVPSGSGSGTWAFTGAGSGTTDYAGTGSGTWTFAGAGVGETPAGPVPTEGAGAGTWIFTGTGVGIAPSPATEGAGAGVWTFTGSGVGSAGRFYLTDTTNRVGGRSRGGYAVATWDPPVVDPPPTLVFGEARDKAQAFSAVTMHGTQPVYDVDVVTRQRHRDRIIVGGKDITYFRDVPTPLPTYQLVSPLLYGPATLRLPQVAAAFEQHGVGALSWLKLEKPVRIQRVDPETGDVVGTDYKGVVIAINASGRDLTVEIGGEASGRAALMEKQLPIFRQVFDIGRHAHRAIGDLGLPFAPYLGPSTGIKLARFGGTGHLDYISQLVARAWTRSGNQWTIMPGADGVYRMFRKDTATIDATAYLDDARVVGDLRRDKAEEPNRIFVTGVTPEGQRVRFGVYPGLKQGKPPPYPFFDNRDFGVGTTDADTGTGDGITLMVSRLRAMKYMNALEVPGGFDADAAAGIREAQDDFDLPITGTMTPATWRRLYDLDATGFSLRGATIQPAAQRSYVKPWVRSGSGAIVARNPNYDKRRLKVDRTIDMGAGLTIAQMREFARTLVADANEDNWVGTITFHTGALIAGSHGHAFTPTADDVFRARRLKPGMNIRLPHSPGGDITVHVSAISVDEDGKVTATVDTRARDSMAVWETIARNRESRANPARQWERQHRASGQVKDAIDGWDEIGGMLGNRVEIPAHTWTGFMVVAGQEGTVRKLLTDTNPNAEYILAVTARSMPMARYRRLIGNPFDVTAHVSSLTVDDGGSGYDSSPDVDITGGGGSGATGHAVIGAGGKVVRVNVVTGGSGYTDTPSVSLTGGGGSGASVTANVSETGSDRWSDPGVRRELDDRLLLYVAGSDEEPLGYAPRKKGGGHPLTGRWNDAAGFSYYTYDQPVLYVAVYADRDTNIPAGRIMWPQLEAGA